jgi:hypothetical protein
MNESHVRPIVSDTLPDIQIVRPEDFEAEDEPGNERVHEEPGNDVLDPDEALVRAVEDFRRVSDRTMEKAERLTARMTDRPPAPHAALGGRR